MEQSSSNIEVSVVIPCLNEAETIASCIGKAQQSIERHALRGEIIVADNLSTDGSQRIAGDLGVRVVSVATKGYGAALMGGIADAKGDYVIMGDADDSYDFGDIFPIMQKLREGFDLVLGCRLPKGGGTIMPGAMPWPNRYIGNPVLTRIGRLFFHAPIHDFHCGLRGFRKDAYERMDLHTTGMEFASEMVIKATLLRMKITEVPITLYRDGRSRPSHLRRWRDGWRHLRFILMYSPQWLFFTPGAAFFIVGALAFALLAKGQVSMGRVVFDTNTLLVSAMFVLLGFQLISFYLFTKTFSMSEGLLPPDPKFEKFMDSLTLEAGIVAGLFSILCGIGLLVVAVRNWAAHDFGPLSYPESLRYVIPSVTLFILGVQIIFSSFVLGILRLRRR